MVNYIHDSHKNHDLYHQTSLFIKREGVFYGQCSEICGVNHGFMPIVVVGESLENYSTWISDKLADL